MGCWGWGEAVDLVPRVSLLSVPSGMAGTRDPGNVMGLGRRRAYV